MSTTSTRTPRRASLLRWLWLPALVAAVLLPIARGRLAAGNGLLARYFTGELAEGRPSLDVVDAAPSTAQVRARWKGAVPGAFVATWDGYLTIPTPDTYTFAVIADDGAQVFVDEQLLVDNGGRHQAQERTGTRRLTSGPHAVHIVFTNGGGDFVFEWRWSSARSQAGTAAAVPAWLLSTSPARYTQVRLARALGLASPAVGALAAVLLLAAFGAWRPRWAVALAGPVCTHAPACFVLHACVRDGVDRRLAAIALPAPPAALSATLAPTFDRALRVVAVVLPAWLGWHALAFWGRGIIDQEAVTFVINYLADRPFLPTIFDPVLNDWGLYQARELAYVFDWMDAHVFARLLVDHHRLLFVPLSSVLSLAAICAIFLAGARRVLRLDWTTALLLLSLFLSCFIVQSSTAILYRSSKMLVSVGLLAFYFRLTALLAPGRRVTPRNVVGLFIIGALMSAVDRQGYAMLLATATVMSVLWLRQRWLPQPGGRIVRAYGPAAVACVAGTLWAVLYNNGLAPAAIQHFNGYAPDFVFEEIPFERFDQRLVLDTLTMFRDQLGYFFGSLPVWGIGALALVVWTAVRVHDRERPAGRGFWAWLTGTGVVVTTAVIGGSLVLMAASGMRHPPVFRIVDHALWYYQLPLQAVLLFSSALALSRLPAGARGTRYGWLVLLMLVAGNTTTWGPKRHVMETSGVYFGKQFAFSELYAQTFDLDEAHAPEAARVLPSWMRVTPQGGEVHLPLQGYGLIDAVRAAYLTNQHRPPLADAGGPHWKELREFLDGGASPLAEPDQVVDALSALQSIGVRRFVIHRAQFESPAAVGQITAALRAMGERVTSLREDNGTLVAELSDVRFPTWTRDGWEPVPRAAMRLGASHDQAHLDALVDGNRDTEWNTNVRQAGDEWIEVTFDQPRAIAGLVLTLTDDQLVRYPRRLEVESSGQDGVRVLFSGSVLPAYMRGILREPTLAPIELRFDQTRTTTLRLRQTGSSPSWGWAVRELTVYEHDAGS